MLLTALLFNLNLYAQKNDKNNIYHKGWIDLNKNGKMDPYENQNLDIEDRINDLLSRMTLDEKTCQMVTLYGYGRVLKDALPTSEWKNESWKDGIGNIDEQLNGFQGFNKPLSNNKYVWPASKHAWAINQIQKFFIEDTRLGIPADMTDEGIRGVEAYKSTDFPFPIGIGSTWDTELVHEIGEITGKEARVLGFTNVYAPILDVERDPRWGRTEESYGESPYLVTQLGISLVKGMQDHYQIAATAKHFAIYSGNKGAREGMGRVDPQTSPRETRNIFLAPFRTVIKEAGLLGIMSSYNDYDGVPITGSKYYLTELLRKQYGFRGYIVSDSDALEYLFSKHHVAATYKDAVRQAINAGLDVRTTFTSPDVFLNPLRELVKEGKLSMNTINERVKDVLRVKFLIGLFDHPYVKDIKLADKIVNNEEHQKVALRAALESLVLLKNQNNLLPLKKDIKAIAICGPNATDTSLELQHYGPLATHVITVLQGIKNEVSSSTKIYYAEGSKVVDANWPESEILPEPITIEEKEEMEKAVENAKKSDVAIVVVGDSPNTIGENKSRTSLDLPGRQLDLIKAVYNTGTPTIVVLINGRALSINWINKYVPSILEAWIPGEKCGEAIAKVLFGDYNPGGKLTVTFPKTVGEVPLNFPAKPNANVDSGDAGVVGVIYPFGFGLSYTTFQYSNLTITPTKQFPAGNINVSFDVENTGRREGDEVVQMYTRQLVSSVTTYVKNLRGFERVHLLPGEKKQVKFTITPDDLKLWNREMNWVVEPGKFKVMIGASSTDIRLQGEFDILPYN
ncbi:MAG: glycoside hydrolase family 3 C-terminal domain-containing protein [Bacteroidetes bacterium]|nr:glycoside hydrolase family 3 C-terminal domain-containing protein [Bacteroidota bacterium]